MTYVRRGSRNHVEVEVREMRYGRGMEGWHAMARGDRCIPGHLDTQSRAGWDAWCTGHPWAREAAVLRDALRGVVWDVGPGVP